MQIKLYSCNYNIKNSMKIIFLFMQSSYELNAYKYTKINKIYYGKGFLQISSKSKFGEELKTVFG